MRYDLVPAVDQDRPWLDELRRSVYRDLFFATWGSWDEGRHRRHCDQCWMRGSIYVVESEGVRVGMMQLFEASDVVEVGEIQIAPEHQSQGIGSRLLRDTIARAHAAGKKVALSTGLQNHRAFQLFLRLGFRHTDQTTRTICWSVRRHDRRISRSHLSSASQAVGGSAPTTTYAMTDRATMPVFCWVGWPPFAVVLTTHARDQHPGRDHCAPY